MTHHVVIFSGGPVPLSLPELDADFVIAADHGADHALKFGYGVDLLVGDLDSVTSVGESAAKKVVRHPIDKDFTDLELALSEASSLGANQVTVVGTFQGRADHSFNNLLVLVSQEWAHMAITVFIDESQVWVVHDSLEVVLPLGTTVSLLPVGNEASGVTTSGLQWSLHDESLLLGEGRGMSNCSVQEKVGVSVRSGVLLVFANQAGRE